MATSNQVTAPRGAVESFDGIAGRDVLARCAHDFLENAVGGDFAAVGACAAMIFQNTPRESGPFDARRMVEAPWRWIAAVANRALEDGDNVLPAQLGLVTHLWNRVVLQQAPQAMFGRLPHPPLNTEVYLYHAALFALYRLPAGTALFDGPGNYSIGDSVEQIGQTVLDLAAQGVNVPADLLDLAAGRFDFPPVPQLDWGGGGPKVDAIQYLNDEVARAQAGDQASGEWARGTYCAMSIGGNDPHAAMPHFEAAAHMGHIVAMRDAGTLAQEMGDSDTARFWREAGAAAGDWQCAWDLAALLLQQGDSTGAKPWLARAAELGAVRAHAVLTSLAVAEGDAETEARWAKSGAEAGDAYCVGRIGLALLDAAKDDAKLDEAVRTIERAGEAGDQDSMVRAGIVHADNGHTIQARMWLLRAEAAGVTQAHDLIVQNGL